LLAAACWLTAVPAAFCQEESKAGEPQKAESFGERYELPLKWVNFIILVGVVGYLVGKNAGPFYVSRARKIREGMLEGQKLREDAEKRAADVDRRLANLEQEIAQLRSESERDAGAETERMRQQASAEVARIRAQAEQEIAAAGKSARLELKRYSAGLAIQLAEQRLRAEMTPPTQDSLVRGFVRDLNSPSSQAHAT
jgi:F-type H+-transporting ATPase subunit b